MSGATTAVVVSFPAAADTGAITEHAIPTPNSLPVSIVAAPDDAFWFTEFAGNQIGCLTSDTGSDEIPIPTAVTLETNGPAAHQKQESFRGRRACRFLASVVERAHLAGDALEQAPIVVAERVRALVLDVECSHDAVADDDRHDHLRAG